MKALMLLHVMFGVFVLLMFRALGSRIHTKWWVIFDLQSPEVGVLFDNFIISLFFSYRGTVM